MTRDEASEGRSVRLAGVVTHVNPDLRLKARPGAGDFFVQDDTGGVYVSPYVLPAGLRVGVAVEVEGRTAPGNFSPVVVPARVRVGGPAPLPAPVPLDLTREGSVWLDAQWVEVWAVVESAEVRNDPDRPAETRLWVATGRGRALVRVPDPGFAARLPAGGAVVTVRGVCATGGTTRPPTVFTAVPPEVVAAPGAGKPVPVGQLTRLPIDRRVTVVGTITAAPGGGRFYLDDGTGGLLVEAADASAEVEPGARAVATGAVERRGPRAVLAGAAVVPGGPAAPVRSLPLRASEVAAGAGADRRVRVEGRVEGVRAADGWAVLALADGGTRFEALAAGPPGDHGLDRLSAGDWVAVSGVAGDYHPGDPGGAFGLILAGPGGVELLDPAPPPAAAPWWTARRVGFLLAGCGAAGLVAGGWVAALRLKVRAAAAELARQYDEKARLQDRLREAAKLEAVGRLAGGIAHDFNNLLTVINGCAELLADELAGPPAALAADIRDAGGRAADLTAQLLAFGRRRPVDIHPLDLNDAVQDAARLLGRVAGEKVEVRLDLAAGLPPVRADRGLIGQVLVNLTANARDAMPAGGAVTVRTAPGPGGVRLSVADTGTGMPPEVAAKVFEPFFTTKGVGQGSGLGLAVVWGIAETLGGRVGVESAPGRGSRFDLDLPPAGG